VSLNVAIETMIPDISYLELLLIVCAFVFGGLCKGISGVGVPIIAVPVIAAVTDIRLAIILIAIPSVIPNIYQVWKYRSSWKQQFPLRSLSILSILGSGIGILILIEIDPKILSQGLGAILLIYIISRRLHAFSFTQAQKKFLAAPAGFLAGIAGGTTGVSAPVILMYLTAIGLSRDAFIFAISVYFIAMGSGQFVWLLASELMTLELTFISTITLIPIAAGMWAGNFIGQRISSEQFNLFLQLFILGLGLKLIAFT
jgi:uncharacterized membrane protein YfcA